MTSPVNHSAAPSHASAAAMSKLSSPSPRRNVGKLSRALVNVHSNATRSAPPGMTDTHFGGSMRIVRDRLTPTRVSNGSRAVRAMDRRSSGSGPKAQLEARLHAICQFDGWMPGAGEACLRDGLQIVSSDPAAALKTLDALASLDFERLAHARSETPEQAQAWQLARWLAANPLGTDVLRACRAHGPVTRIQLLQLQSIHMVDQGQSMVSVAHGLDSSRDPAPGAVAARHASMSPDEIAHGLARRVWDASTHLAGQADASDAMNASGAPIMKHLTDQQAGDVFAWEQGLRAEGSGGDAALARRYIHKFATKTLQRAGASRFRHGLARLLGKGRTALDAMRYVEEASRPERINRWFRGEAPGYQENLKSALRRTMEELQPGESVRLVSQYRAGAQVDALGDAFKTVTGEVITPLIAFKGTRTHESLVTLERTHYGWEIFIGNGRTTKLNAGVGVSVGLGTSSGKVASARAGGVVLYAGANREVTKREGVTIRIAQPSAAGEDGANDKAGKVLAHLLNPSAQSPSHGRHEWNRLAKEFGDDPTISISSARQRLRNKGAVVVGEVGPSVAGNVANYEARLGAGLRAVAGYHSSSDKSGDTSGRVQAVDYSDSKGWTITGDVYAGLGFSASLGDTSAFVQPMWAKRGFFEQKFLHKVKDSHVRLVSKDGHLVPDACIRRNFVPDLKTYCDAVKAQRSQWIEQFAVEAASSTGTAASLDAARGHATDAIDLHLRDVADQRGGSYCLSLKLREEACRAIDAELALIEHGADASTADRAQARIGAVLADPSRWAPLECSVTTETSSKKGRFFRLPVELGSNEKYTRQKVQARLDASRVQPTPETSSSTPAEPE